MRNKTIKTTTKKQHKKTCYICKTLGDLDLHNRNFHVCINNENFLQDATKQNIC